MSNSKNTKRALLASVLSVVLCLSMLVGSTFAWFTDTASTGVNKIVAGNLDIELSYKNAVTNAQFVPVSVDADDLFVQEDGTDILWEPGAAAVCYFKVENKGSLALQYNLKVAFDDTVTYDNNGTVVKLSDALKSAVVAMADENGFADRAAAVKAAKENSKGNALGYSATNVKMLSKDTQYMAMVIWMPEDTDNTYNLPTGARPLEIKLGIDLTATQVMEENDSFGNDYDAFPQWPAMPDRSFVADTLPYTSEAINKIDYVNNWSISIPAGGVQPHASNPNPTTVTVEIIPTSGDNTVTYDFNLVDEKGNAMTLNKPATLQVQLGIGLEDVAVVDNTNASYNQSNGQLRVTVAQTGAFVVNYTPSAATIVYTADEFIAAMNSLNDEEGGTIMLGDDINMAGKTWTGVHDRSFTLLGNGKTIRNITNSVSPIGNKGIGGLVNEVGAGRRVVVKNLTMENVVIGDPTGEEDVAPTLNTSAGAVIGFVGPAVAIELEDVHVTGSTIAGFQWVGGLMGYSAGYADTSNGAVYQKISVKNCSVTGTTVKGDDASVGGVIGHAGGDSFSLITIDDFKGTGNTLDGGKLAKVGLVIGTAGVGEANIVNCDAADFSGNTVEGAANGNQLVGRFVPNNVGTLTVNGADQGKAYKELVTLG